MNKLERVKGALYGFCIGDSMGATTEFMPKEEIKKSYGEVNQIIGGGILNWKEGEPTDDTDMMLCVADAIITSVDQEDFLQDCADNFSMWFSKNPKDVGGQIRKVISNCYGKDYKYWVNFALDDNALGNGALMRALPACFESEEYAISQGMLTHNNKEQRRVLSDYYFMIDSIINNNYKDKKFFVKSESNEGNVSTTWLCAKYYFKNNNNFKDAIIQAVNNGNDSDTVAAITGSLSGAYYGYDSIPKDWVNSLFESTKKNIESFLRYLEDENRV